MHVFTKAALGATAMLAMTPVAAAAATPFDILPGRALAGQNTNVPAGTPLDLGPFTLIVGAYSNVMPNGDVLTLGSEGYSFRLTPDDSAPFDLNEIVLTGGTEGAKLSYSISGGPVQVLQLDRPGAGEQSYAVNLQGISYLDIGFRMGSANFARLVGATNVPEPASWALMLAGFGLTGYALRRRRALLAYA